MSKNKTKGSKSSDTDDSSGSDFGNFMTVFFYCLLIILSPVFSFFAGKKSLETFFDFSEQSNNIYSAVIAVIVLHLALGVYLYRAYSGSEKPKTSQVKQD